MRKLTDTQREVLTHICRLYLVNPGRNGQFSLSRNLVKRVETLSGLVEGGYITVPGPWAVRERSHVTITEKGISTVSAEAEARNAKEKEEADKRKQEREEWERAVEVNKAKAHASLTALGLKDNRHDELRGWVTAYVGKQEADMWKEGAVVRSRWARSAYDEPVTGLVALSFTVPLDEAKELFALYTEIQQTKKEEGK